MQLKARGDKNFYDGQFLLYLLWPFGAMVRSFVFFRKPESRYIVWLFFIFFGFVFVYSRDVVGGADSARYAQLMVELNGKEVSFRHLLAMIYTADGFADIYQPLTTWIVSFFTSNPRWLFALYAGVFGYFMVQNIWTILEKMKPNTRIDAFLLLLILAFVLVNPIWNINGARMWTAVHILIFGIFRYLIHGKKNGLIWAAVSVLVHFSLIFPLSLFYVYVFFLKKFVRHKAALPILLSFYIISSLLSELDLQQVQSLLSFLPGFLMPRVESYTNEAYIAEVADRKSSIAFAVRLGWICKRFVMYAWIFVVFFYRKQWLNRFPQFYNLFALALFIGGFARIASMIPSGGRFITVISILFYGVFVVFVSDRRNENVLGGWKLITFPFLLYLVVHWIRYGLDYMGLSSFMSNPILALVIEDTKPALEVIKNIL